MKILWVIVAGLILAFAARADEDQTPTPAEFVSSAQDWMEENVDDWVFEITGLDRESVTNFLTRAESELRASAPAADESEVEAARRFLKSLGEYEEARPYALWLTSFLEKRETEESVQPKTPRSPEVAAKHGSPTRLTPEDRREKWIRILSRRTPSSRAMDYATELKPIFVAERVPAELVWVAEVESAFNPEARSPAGAVGLFQLMPDTARSLDLSLWPFDQRKQPWRNARAAARYLRHLDKRFGDWQLALAAYNGGETRVARLLNKTGAGNYASIADKLPAETQDYVPKVEATIWVREGVSLSELVTAQN